MTVTKIGIIGAGGNASGHARYYASSPRSEVVAIADPFAEAAQKLASEVGAEAVDDFTALLNQVDAVVVSSPNPFHRDQAVACAAAGKHVYCEKPMGINYAEAKAIAEAVRAAKVRCAIGFSVSASPVIQTLLKRLRTGDCGPLVGIMSRRMMNLGDAVQKGWRADHSKTGGLLYEINIHEIEWMMRLAGSVESAYGCFVAEGKDDPIANDHLAVTLNFASGAFGMHQGSQLSPFPSFMKSVEGRSGAFFADGWGAELRFARRDGGEAETVQLEPQIDLREDFLNGIQNGTPLFNDFEWGLKVMAVAEAIVRSAAGKRAVRIDEIV